MCGFPEVCYLSQLDRAEQPWMPRRFGKEFTWAVKAKMMGRTAMDAANIMISDLSLEGQLDAAEFVKEREVAPSAGGQSSVDRIRRV